MPDGQEVFKYTLTNKEGVSASFITLGAVWVSMAWCRTGRGRMADVVLGYDDVESYLQNPAHFGAPIGRNANRIGGAVITIDGVDYKLAANNGPNNLHSGPDLYHRTAVGVQGGGHSAEGDRLDFFLESPDGDQGYPGNAKIRVSYTLTEDSRLLLDYQMVSDKDTVANFTNHSYFNLAGHDGGEALDQEVWLNASCLHARRTRVPSPPGRSLPVAGTPMDFTQMKAYRTGISRHAFEELRSWEMDIDHNWVLDHAPGVLSLAARARDPKSGRAMETYTDLPGRSVLHGQRTERILCREREALHYGRRQAYCFETQYYPDACHKPQFPSPILKAGRRPTRPGRFTGSMRSKSLYIAEKPSVAQQFAQALKDPGPPAGRLY